MPTHTPATKTRTNEKAISTRAMVLLSACVVILDQLIKFIAVQRTPNDGMVLIPGIMNFTHVKNTGVSFGLFQGNNLLMIFVAIIILGILIYFFDQFKTKVQKIAYALILSGLFGNVIDRIIHGYVVDMFDLGWWPVFNIADSAICIAVAMIIIEEITIWVRNQSKLQKPN